MLSLAKLAAFASADSDLTIQLESINAELNIIDYQEQLSEALLQNYGYDVENPKVLKVEEMINVIILKEYCCLCFYTTPLIFLYIFSF